MVFIIVTINIIIALICWLIAVKIWQIRSTIANVANILENAAKVTHNGLVNCPQTILAAKISIANFNQNYQNKQSSFNKMQQILFLLQFGYRIKIKQSKYSN